MSLVIEIEGATTRLVDRTVLQEAPTAMVESQLTISRPFITPRLPSGTDLSVVFAYFDDANKAVKLLIERPPRTETVRIELIKEYTSPDEIVDFEEYRRDFPAEILQWHGIADYNEFNRTLELPVPWEYYSFEGVLRDNPAVAGQQIFVLSTARLFWKPNKLKTFGDMVYHAKLPNILDGQICWGDTNQATDGNLGEKVASMILNFYNTPFNEDYGHLDLPRPISQFPIATDGLGLPDYNWAEFSGTYLGWTLDPSVANLMHTTLEVPTQTRPTNETPADSHTPPADWQIQGIRDWYANLSPARRMYVDHLHTIVPATVADPVAA